MKSFLALALVLSAHLIHGDEQLRHQSFDQSPQWDGHNNRSTHFDKREIQQDFGYDAENQRIGGLITPDGRPVFYATEIPATTMDEAFLASGSLVVEKGAGNTLLGFFNSGTVNEWRTPNSIVLRINGRGDTFHVHFEYGTSKWRASAGVIGRHDAAADRVYPIEQPGDKRYAWSLAYDPGGNEGNGLITATFGDATATCAVSAEHRADGATFNRFGILNTVKSADTGGTLWIDDLILLGDPVNLGADPQWEGLRNRESYVTAEVRPRFDFGFSPTHFAGGAASGEIGGLFYRGDCRYPEKLAYYGDVLEALSLEAPLHASGKVVLRQGVTDSTTLFGFFHAEHSMEVNDSQENQLPRNFIGFAIDGPSAEGFYLYPAWRVQETRISSHYGAGPAHIHPDGTPHSWRLDYGPSRVMGGGELVFVVDDHPITLQIPQEALDEGPEFNRLGFITTWIDGNGQRVFVDDLRYTWQQ